MYRCPIFVYIYCTVYAVPMIYALLYILYHISCTVYLFYCTVNAKCIYIQADDDTFAIMENLRYFLADKNPMDPVYYGHHFKTIVRPQGYYSGGNDLLTYSLAFSSSFNLFI